MDILLKFFFDVGHGAVDIESTAQSSRRRWAQPALRQSPDPPSTGCWLGRVFLQTHSVVLLDEQPEVRNVRAKALRGLSANPQAVVGPGGVRYVV